MTLLILPGDPEFEDTLAAYLPPDALPDSCFVARSGSGVLEAVSFAEMMDYSLGGELEQRLLECGEIEQLEDLGG